MRRRHGKTVLSVAILLILACFLQCIIIYRTLNASSFSSPSKSHGIGDEPPPPTISNANNTDKILLGEDETRADTRTLVPRWSAINETKVGIHLFSKNIDIIRIIGERHSGTTFFEKHLQDCFPDQTVVAHFVRKKHWFQPSPEEVIDAARTYGIEGLKPTELENVPGYKSWWQIGNSPDPRREFNTSLVLLLVRNPYDWLEAMRQKPHHWPNHVDLIPVNSSTLKRTKYKPEGAKARRRLMHASQLRHATRRGPQQSVARKKKKPATIYETPEGTDIGGSMGPGSVHRSFFTKSTLDWQEFLSRPLVLQDYNDVDSNSLCQKGFSFGAVSPCIRNITFIPSSVKHIPRSFLRKLPFDINDVVYELAPGTRSKPHDHPMRLRAEKLENFLSIVRNWELGGFGLIRYEDIIGAGLQVSVQRVAEVLNIQSRCPVIHPFQSAKREIPQEFRTWITNVTDWNLESIVGYFPDI
jgi:hypothetical protein